MNTQEETDVEDDIIKLITKARNEGDQWFKVEIILPFEDSQIDLVAKLQTNMERLLLEGMELMSDEKSKELPEVEKPRIILPN